MRRRVNTGDALPYALWHPPMAGWTNGATQDRYMSLRPGAVQHIGRVLTGGIAPHVGRV